MSAQLNVKNGWKKRISQQSLTRCYLNLKLKLLGSNQSGAGYQMKTASNGRQPPMEDGLQWKMTSKYEK
jgi:hypothetical protein